MGRQGKEHKFLARQVSSGQTTNALACFDFVKITAAVWGSRTFKVKMQMLKVTGFKDCMAQNTRNIPLLIAEAFSSLDSASS